MADLMNIEKAFRILGVSEDEDPDVIRKRFRELLFKYHPDQAGDDPRQLAMAQQVILAYSHLRENGILKEAPGQADDGIRKNEKAFVKRKIFMQETLFGDDITVDTGMYGKYCRDPGIESFPLLLKSVSASAERLLNRYRDKYTDKYTNQYTDETPDMAAKKVKLLHLLLQQFIDPYSSIHQVESVRHGEEPHSYRIPCHAKPAAGISLRKGAFEAGTYPVIRTGNKLIIEEPAAGERGMGEKMRCDISFSDNALYYIVTPMILQGAAEGTFHQTEPAGRQKRREYLTGELILFVDEEKGKDATEKINEEIRKTLS